MQWLALIAISNELCNGCDMQWADSILTVVMNIWLPLFWSTWSWARSQDLSTCAGLEKVMINLKAIVEPQSKSNRKHFAIVFPWIFQTTWKTAAPPALSVSTLTPQTDTLLQCQKPFGYCSNGRRVFVNVGFIVQCSMFKDMMPVLLQFGSSRLVWFSDCRCKCRTSCLQSRHFSCDSCSRLETHSCRDSAQRWMGQVC